MKGAFAALSSFHFFILHVSSSFPHFFISSEFHDLETVATHLGGT